MSGAVRTVCVYCASSEAIDGSYREIAGELGGALAGKGWDLVYGGGGIGLMGELARAALAGGARVTGVIPHRLADRELAYTEVTELIRTDTMRQRKEVMDARSDAFVILPGGIGTLEELVEIITLKQLGFHNRAVVILDAEGFWDPLVAQLQRMVEQRFSYREVLDLFQVTADVAGTITALEEYSPPAHREPSAVTLEVWEGPPSSGAQR